MSYDKKRIDELKAYVTKCEAYIHSGHSSGYEVEYYRKERESTLNTLKQLGEQLEFDFS